MQKKTQSTPTRAVNSDKPMVTWRSMKYEDGIDDANKVFQLLMEEIHVHRRWSIALRLHRRYCALRAKDERDRLRLMWADGGELAAQKFSDFAKPRG